MPFKVGLEVSGVAGAPLSLTGAEQRVLERKYFVDCGGGNGKVLRPVDETGHLLAAFGGAVLEERAELLRLSSDVAVVCGERSGCKVQDVGFGSSSGARRSCKEEVAVAGTVRDEWLGGVRVVVRLGRGVEFGVEISAEVRLVPRAGIRGWCGSSLLRRRGSWLVEFVGVVTERREGVGSSGGERLDGAVVGLGVDGEASEAARSRRRVCRRVCRRVGMGMEVGVGLSGLRLIGLRLWGGESGEKRVKASLDGGVAVGDRRLEP